MWENLIDFFPPFHCFFFCEAFLGGGKWAEKKGKWCSWRNRKWWHIFTLLFSLQLPPFILLYTRWDLFLSYLCLCGSFFFLSLRARTHKQRWKRREKRWYNDGVAFKLMRVAFTFLYIIFRYILSHFFLSFFFENSLFSILWLRASYPSMKYKHE